MEEEKKEPAAQPPSDPVDGGWGWGWSSFMSAATALSETANQIVSSIAEEEQEADARHEADSSETEGTPESTEDTQQVLQIDNHNFHSHSRRTLPS